MASKEEPGGSFSSPLEEDEQVPEEDDKQKHPFKFINSQKGKKALVMDGFIYYVHSKFRESSYFKCAHRTKGCRAGVSLKNWNQEDCSFDSYLIMNREHLNHLPSPDKIRKREEKQNKVVMEKAPVVDLKSPEFLNSNHVCLFCLSGLPSNYLSSCTLDNVVPYGQDLTISLDNPTKNSQAFDLLCSLLNVKWRRDPKKCRSNFDQSNPLPLCLKCQNLYQEVFQLNVQIRELEVLINKRIKVIRGLVERSGGENENIKIGHTQLALLGLDNFRRRVKDVNFNFGCDADENNTQPSPPKINTITAPVTKIEPEVDIPISPPSPSPNLEQLIIKQEMDPEEDQSSLEDNYEPPWLTEEVKSQENRFDDDNLFPPPGDDKILPPTTTTIIPPRTRSIRLAAQRATGRVAATATSGSDDHDDHIDHSESDSDPDTKIKTKRPPPFLRLSSSLKPSSKYSPLSKPYSCNLCSKILLGIKSLSLHYSQDHPDKQKFTCKFCPKHYPTFRDVSTHQRRHTGEKPFKCPHCPFSTSHRCSLPQHISNRHSTSKKISSPSPHPCPSCPKKFPSKSILTNHLISSHNQPPSIKFYKRSGKPIKFFTCHLCDAKIQGQGPLSQHYSESHPTQNKYTCKFCPAHYPFLREVLNHQRRRHTGDRPFKCDHCPKSFTTKTGLLSHQNVRHSPHPPELQCPQCPKRFPTQTTLTGHIAYQHRDRNTVTFCKTCGQAFRHPSGFPSHNQKIHKGTALLSQPVKDIDSVSLESLETTLNISFDIEQRVKCHICWKLIIPDKLFIQKHFDKSHGDHKGTIFNCYHCGQKFNRYRNCLDHTIKRHSNLPKGYQCDKCVNSYYSQSELDKHQLSHVPMEERKKDHVCDLCGVGLCSGWALYYHRRKHKEEVEGKDKVKWVCEQCGKSYSGKRGLEKHKKVVHRRELRWRCGQCDKAFVERTLLRRHERNHLGEKGFKCGICGVGFVHPASKTRHEREVHGVGGGEKGRKTDRRRGEQGEGEEMKMEGI